jgi:hypothetical protein
MRRTVILLVASIAAGCGGSPAAKTPADDVAQGSQEAQEPEAPVAPEEAAPAPKPEEKKPLELPTECANGSSKPCLMPRAFVKALCADAYPELALYFFAKDSPWTRIYLSAREVEPFNGLGGPSSDKNLVFDEELLVLSERSPNLGGMSVSGVGKSYDVLRWDGTCATLQEGEVRLYRPPSPKHANVEWRHLDMELRNAFRADKKIASLAKKRRKECKGVTMGAVSAACEKADAQLKERVVTLVRTGFEVPKPKTLPVPK